MGQLEDQGLESCDDSVTQLAIDAAVSWDTDKSPLSLPVGFCEQASPEDQAEVVLPFMT